MNKLVELQQRFQLNLDAQSLEEKDAAMQDKLAEFALASGDGHLMEMAARLAASGWTALAPEEIRELFAAYRTGEDTDTSGHAEPVMVASAATTTTDAAQADSGTPDSGAAETDTPRSDQNRAGGNEPHTAREPESSLSGEPVSQWAAINQFLEQQSLQQDLMNGFDNLPVLTDGIGRFGTNHHETAGMHGAHSLGVGGDYENRGVITPFVVQHVRADGSLYSAFSMPGRVDDDAVLNPDTRGTVGGGAVHVPVVTLQSPAPQSGNAPDVLPPPPILDAVRITRATDQDPSVDEGTAADGITYLTFTVTRSFGTKADNFVYTLSGITADDLASGELTGTIAFAAGETTKDIVVAINQDSTVEADETVSIALSGGQYGVVVGGAAQVVVANDDYAIVDVSADESDVIEGTSAGTAYTDVTFTVTRTAPAGQVGDLLADTIDWLVLTSGTGNIQAADIDPTTASGSISFAAGQITATVTVRVLKDALAENGNEALTLNLSTAHASGAVLGIDSATTTVIDDDGSVGIALATGQAASVDEGTATDGVTTLTFTVTRSNGSLPDSFTYTVSGITADDLASGNLTGTVAFAAGETTKDITVQIAQDSTVESNETVTVSLADGTYAQVDSGAASASVIVTNDDKVVMQISEDAGAVIEGNGDGYTPVTFTVTRALSSGATGSLPADDVPWSVVLDGGNGYIDASDIHADDQSGTVHFAAGATSATITVRVLADGAYETDESLTVSLGTTAIGDVDQNAASATTLVANDDPTIEFATASQTVVEGGVITFTVERTTGLDDPDTVTLDYEIVPMSLGDSSLPASQDRTGTISFAPGASTATITVQTVDDQLVNGDQRFYVALSSDNPAVHIDGSTVAGTITSNDAEMGLEAIVASDPDADTGLVTYTVTVTRTGALGFSHTVNWTIVGVGENPASDTDFTLPDSQQITFDANTGDVASDSQTFSFLASPGLIINGERSFEVRLEESADNVVLGVDAIRANIVPTGVSASIVPISANSIEGTGSTTYPQTFEIRLSEATTQDVVISWTAVSYGSGTSQDANAADFGAAFPSGSVTIAAGETSAQITVTPSPDSNVESSEKYYVQIAVDSGPAGVTISQAIGTIINDDALLGLTGTAFTANEGAAGSDGVLVAYVAREGFARSTVSANWHVELINGQATAGDFAAGQDALGTNGGLPSGTIELVPGQAQGEIHVTLAGDNVLENAENFRIVLDTPGYGTQLSSVTTATATIVNDDAVFSMQSATLSHAEGQAGQTPTIDVTVVRTGDTRSAATVSWAASGSGANPTNASDFNGQLAGTLTFSAGASSAVIHIPVKGDDVLEADEQFTVTLTGTTTAQHTLDANSANLSTVVTLLNDDATVAFDSTAGNVSQSKSEDGTGHAGQTFDYILTRSGDLSQAATVNWHLDFSGKTASSGDFAATSGTATFAAGSSTATLTVTPVNDIVVENNETFAVVLDTPATGSGLKLGATTSATGTLVNDDVAINAVLTGASSEGDSGTTTYTYTLTRSGDTTNQSSTINWSVAGAQISQSGIIYANALSEAEIASVVSSDGGSTLTWAAGDTGSKTITVTVNGDTVVEGDEAFQLTLSNATGDHSQLNANGLYGIVHDDDASVSIVAVSSAQTEGAAGTSRTLTYQVARTGDLSTEVTVDLDVSGATGVSGPSSVTFSAYSESAVLHFSNGQPDQTIQISGGDQTVDISYTVAGDNTLESGEALLVSLGTVHTASGHNVVIDATHGSASIAILNDDDRIVTTAASSITEGDSGTTPLTFTLTRDPAGPLADATVQWRIVGNGDVVVNADDFAPGQEDASVANDGMPSGVVHFVQGATSAQVTVYIQGDTAIEADEGLALHLSVAAGNTETEDYAVTLVGDDVGFNAIARDAIVTEGNNPAVARYLIFDLVRAGDTASEKTVDWSIAGLDAGDVANGQLLSGSVTFAAGQTGASVRIEILQDSIVDIDKTAILTLTDPDNGDATLATASSSLTDDDAQLTITANTASIAEGTDSQPAVTTQPDIDGITEDYKTLTFTVTREGNLQQVSTVDWSVSGTGINAADFWEGILPTGTLTFAVGETQKTISVNVKSDSLKEGDETLAINLGTPSAGTSNAVASATTTITNDDAEVAFNPGSLTVSHAEGDSGTTTFSFDLVRTGNTAQASTVTWTVGGGQVDVNDFSGYTNIYGQKIMPSGEVTFSAGETSKTITVTVNADTFSAARAHYWWGDTPTVVNSTLENTENFNVTLSSPTIGTSIGADGVAQGTIVNDDVRIQVTAIHTNLPEGTLPDGNGDVDPSQAGVQDHIPQSITLTRMGDTSHAESIEWYVPTANFTTQIDSWTVTYYDSDGAVYKTVDSAAWAAAHGGTWTYGVITWAALASDASYDPTASVTITFNPHPDDTVEVDYSFQVKVRPVTSAADIDTDLDPNQTPNTALIDEFSSGTSTSLTQNYNFSNESSYLTLGTFTVKRDESGVWVSNEVIPSFDSWDSLQTGINQQYSGYDGWNGIRYVSYGTSGVYYSGSDSANQEGSLGTATAGSDYTATSGTLTFTDATRVQTVTVAINNDSSYETSEGFGLFLDNVSGATIGTDQATTTILDDDNVSSGYRVSVQGGTSIESIDQYAQFTVNLGKALTQTNTFTIDLGSTGSAAIASTSGEAADFSHYFDYSTNGGATWLTNAPVFNFTYTGANKPVADQLEIAYQFDNSNGGNSFDNWLDFSDLKAGAGYKVGGTFGGGVAAGDQYVATIRGQSSEYGVTAQDGWSAEQIIGAPDVGAYGDDPNAWAPSTSGSGAEWVEVGFATPVKASAIEIRETYSNGFVYQVDLIDTDGNYHTVWQGQDNSQQGVTEDFRIEFPATSYNVVGAKIYTQVSGYEEIDSIKLIAASQNVAATYWIPVRADAVINFAGLSFDIAGTAGQASGAFAGVADLSDPQSATTQSLLSWWNAQIGGGGSATVDDVRQYFDQYAMRNTDGVEVKFLKFDVLWDGQGSAPTWSIGGLDAAVVVAPQNGSVWSDLEVIQDVTLSAGHTTVSADIALGSQAAFTTGNGLTAVGAFEPNSLQPGFTVTSDTLDANNIRTVTIDVTRINSSLDDVIAYHLNIPQINSSAFLNGSALPDGTVSFAAGEATATLTFRFDATLQPIEPAPIQHDIHVVVDSYDGGAVQAYIDTDADGVLDAEEAVDSNLAFDAEGNDLVNLAFNRVTIRFNDAPDATLNVQGFGADDKIELNLDEFGANGWRVGTLYDQWQSGWRDMSSSGSIYRATSYKGVYISTPQGSGASFYLTAYRSNWTTAYLQLNGVRNSSWTTPWLATFGSGSSDNRVIDGKAGLMKNVSFVHNPELHIVVDGSGAFIDSDGDGVHDDGETVQAFDSSGNALIDLAHNQVVVHFNDAPDTALDFSGFGRDDRIEIDVQAFKDNGWTGFAGAQTHAAQGYCSSWWLRSSSKRLDFATGSLRAGATRGYYSTTTYNAVWISDGSQSASLAHFGTGMCWSSLNRIIDGNGGLMNRVSFVDVVAPAEDVRVIVGHVGDGATGAYVDTNADGVLQAGEANADNLAFDASGNDLIGLAANHVTIQFNETPDAALNFQGFGADDKVEVNLTELARNGWSVGQPNVTNRWNWSGHTSGKRMYGDTANGSGFAFCITADRAPWQSQPQLRLYGSNSSSGWTNAILATFGPPSDANHIVDGRGGFMNQVSFVTNPEVHVVVEHDGAWIDTNANGILDAEEQIDANRAFYNGEDLVNLAGNSVVVKFNDVPLERLNFSGFGKDDRIEIDVSALQANGGKAGTNVTTQWASNSIRGGSSSGSSSSSSWRSWTRHSSSRGYTGLTRSGNHSFWLGIEGNRRGSSGYVYRNSLRLFANSDSGGIGGNLATFGSSFSANPIIDGNFSLLNRVSFVQSDVQHVIVERDGAWIDSNNDGVLSDTEKTDANLAFDFSVADGESNAIVDLAHNKVVIRFNDAPTQALDLSSFGADDRIEIDRTALGVNGWHGATNSMWWNNSSASSWSGGACSSKRYSGWNSAQHASAGLRLSAYRSSSGSNGLWLHTWVSGSSSTSNRATLAYFGDNTQIVNGSYDTGLMRKVAFVTSTIHVVVDSDGAYVDTNANGERDAAETSFAFDPDSGADLIGLANNRVVIQFNDAPNTALDLSGFGYDDRIEIDRDAFAANGWSGALATQFHTYNSQFGPSAAVSAKYFNNQQSSSISVETLVFLQTGLKIDALRLGSSAMLLAGGSGSHATDVYGNAALAWFGSNSIVNGYGDLMNRVSFVNSVVSGFDGDALSITQGGSVSGGSMSYSDVITVDAGADSILIRTLVTDDNIDEAVETIGLTVTQDSGDTFLVPAQSGTTVLVDNDSPQISQGANTLYDTQLQQYYLMQTVDINNRYGDTPNTYNNGSYYYSNSLSGDAGSSQAMTVTVRFQGSWELALISEEMGQTGQGYTQAGVTTSTNALHNSPPPFTLITGGTPELDPDTGEPTGYFTYEIEVPVGTEQIVMRSAITVDQYNSGAGELTATQGFDVIAEVTHVDPVIVARQTSVNEADGSVNIEVIAVGGDLGNGQTATVDYSTADGQWVDRTFVVSREYATAGELTLTWTVQSLTNSAATATTGQLVDGDGYYDYVSGYFGQSVIGTVSPDDFVILGDQSADGTTGLPTGTVTFADGQKEATITVRVRADNVGEAPEDFRVVLGDVPSGVQLLGDPQAPLSYADLGYAGYAKIVNDDQVFTITGAVFNESISSKASSSEGTLSTGGNNGMAVAGTPTGMTAPDGYTLHQFVITREGDSTAAASVDWVIQVKGIDGSGGFIETSGTDQADGAHQAEIADFLTGDVPYGVTWQAADGNGVTSSVAQTVTFAAGETQKVVTIAIADDALIEDAEQFTVALTNPVALPGNEGQPGVSETRGSADFLIGDNDGTTVSVAISWLTNSSQSLDGNAMGNPLVDGAMSEGTGADWLDGNGSNTNTDGDTSNDRQLVLTFTRSAADTTASQAFFQLDFSNTQNYGYNSLDLISGSAYEWQWSDSSLWRGTVDFAAGETTATVIFRVPDDNLVETDNQVTVTLYDAEHLPQAVWAADGYFGGATMDDVAGIGRSGALPDWNTTIRDPNAYIATATITNDDTRLWLNSFSSGGYSDFYYGINPWAPALVVDEGNPDPAGVGDQIAAGSISDLTVNFARAGVQSGDIALNWQVLLNGTATASDFNSAYWVDGNGDPTTDIGSVAGIRGTVTVAGSSSSSQETTVNATIVDFFAADYNVEDNETFQLQFTTPSGTNALFTPDWRYEAPGSSLYDARLKGQDTMTVNMTVDNDDVSYGIALHSGNNGKVTEGDSGSATFSFDVTREIGATDTGGYHYGSTVYWRVVGIGSHAATVADFQTTGVSGYSVVNGEIVGSVSFNGQSLVNSVWTSPVDGSDLLRTVSLMIKGDSTVEYGENFRIELFDPSYGYVDQAAASVDGTIVNDDTGVLINDFSVREGDSGNTTVTATVTRVGELSGSSSMDWTKFNIDTNSTDFGTGNFSGSLTLGNGNGETGTVAQVDGYGEETKTFTLNLNGDATVESDEQFQLFLSNVQGVDQVIDNSAIVTVLNDDTVFSVTNTPGYSNTYDENSGDTYSFRITRSVATPQDQTVTWSVLGAGGRNVVDGTDFGGSLPSGTVTFSGDELYKDITVPFSAFADNTPEADEVFTVAITSFGSGAENDTYVAPTDGSNLGVIVNDDAAVFISDSQAITQIEGSGSNVQSYKFDVIRSGPVTGTSTVDWAIALDGTATIDDFDAALPTSDPGDGTAWYDTNTNSIRGTVTFTVDGYDKQTVSVGLNPDTTPEDSESFHIVLSNPTSGTAIVDSSNDALGMIGDDDYDLSIADAQVSEGDGNNTISFTVTRTGAPDLAASVTWSLAFGSGATYADANDFRATSGSFTFPAGATSYTFTVPVRGDVQWEADETFTINLDYDRNNGTSGTASATGTLLNDDEGFSVAEIDPVLEGSSGASGVVTFRVVRDGNTTGSSTVDWTITGSGLHPAADNDFAGATSGSVAFADGETYKDVTVTLAGDGTAEFDEGYTVTLSNAGPGSSIRSATADGVIVNDDIGYSVSADVTSVVEGDSGTSNPATITFTITRSADQATLAGTASQVSWALSTASGDSTALQAADFVGGATGGTATFAAGASTATVTLQLVGDALKEGDATMRLTLGNPNVGSVISGSGTADVTVTDDDDQLALVAQQAASISEGNPAQDGAYKSYDFLVTRTGSSLGIATVDWAVVGTGAHQITADDINSIWVNGVQVSSADFANGTISFADGDLDSKTIEVRVNTDRVGEFAEQFAVNLSNASYGSTVTTSSVTQTIGNDDPALSLSMANTNVAEGGEGTDTAFTFTVTRSGDTSGISTVNWAIEAVSGALHTVNAEDFGGFFPSGLVTFNAGESVKTVTVLTQGDNIAEENESFRVVLSNASGADVVGASYVDATLVNDDVGVSVSARNAAQLEGQTGTSTRYIFDLSATGTSAAASAVVHWHVEGAGLHPTNAADFTSGQDTLGLFGGLPSGVTTVLMASGSGSGTVNVYVAGDNTYGPDEQFKVVIDSVDAYDQSQNALGASVVSGEATSTTLDDDTLIGLHQGASHAVLEGNSGTTELRFYIDDLGHSTNSPTLDNVRVSYHISGETNADDFVAISGSGAALQHDGNGYYIGVQINGDTTVEANERFTLTLDSAYSATTGGVEIAQQGATAGGTILGDDYGLSIVSPSTTQTEDAARFVFDILRDGPVDQSMDVDISVGVPGLQGVDGASANDFINPATGLPYAVNDQITATLHYAAGQTSARFTLEASHDLTAENDEVFTVMAQVARIGGYDVTATASETVYIDGWITNDDGAIANGYQADPALELLQHAV